MTNKAVNATEADEAKATEAHEADDPMPSMSLARLTRPRSTKPMKLPIADEADAEADKGYE